MIDFTYSISVAPKLPIPAVPSADHGSKSEQLASMIRDHDFSALQNYGGASLSVLITSPGFVMSQNLLSHYFYLLGVMWSGFEIFVFGLGEWSSRYFEDKCR